MATTVGSEYDHVNIKTGDNIVQHYYKDAELRSVLQKGTNNDAVFNAPVSLGRKANTTIGLKSTALGYDVEASGDYSVAMGYGTVSSSTHSFAEGSFTTASAYYSHAEGRNTNATAIASHAEGSGTTASAQYCHAEGDQTTASRNAAHAEGDRTSAEGTASHSEGGSTVANGNYSHAAGFHTAAYGKSTYVFGEYNTYNDSDPRSGRSDYVEIVGNGTADNARSNARTLDWSGNESLAGGLTLGKGTADETTITAAQLKALLALLN